MQNAKDDSESPDPNLPQCSDGKDNDGDGNVDYPEDKECSAKDDDSEGKRAGGAGSWRRGCSRRCSRRCSPRPIRQKHARPGSSWTQ